MLTHATWIRVPKWTVLGVAIVAVIPASDEPTTIRNVAEAMPKRTARHFIVVQDVSRDRTRRIGKARALVVCDGQDG